jgi:hypothetical protein
MADLLEQTDMPKRTCTICGAPHKALGYCSTHHQRLRKWGNPEGPPRELGADGERWLPIPDYEGLYEASDWGRIRSMPRYRDWHSSNHGRILRQDTQHALHQRVTLYKDGKRSRIFVHRLVMLAFVGPCPPGMETRHLDGNPLNNRLENLVYGTRQENAQDRVNHGRDAHARMTHCESNHEYTPANTRIKPNGSRECIACRKKRDQARRR